MQPVAAMTTTMIRLALGVTIGLAVAHVSACGEQSDDPDDIVACRDFCDRQVTCDDRNRGECEENCRQLLDDCVDDEKDEALSILDSCGGAACDELTECTVDAGIECIFGI